MSKIKKITVSNLKAAASVTADFNGCTAIITGGNNKGKSSFLKSLPDRIRGIKPDVVLKHGESEGFAELELTSGEKFIWTFDNKSKAGEKLTFITKDNIKTSVSREISQRFFPQAFDIDKFLNKGPKDQKEILQKTIGIDLSSIELKYKSAYDDRTYKNKVLAAENAKALPVDESISADHKPVAGLQAELAGIESYNENRDRVTRGVKERKDQIVSNNTEIELLEARIKVLKENNAATEKQIKEGDEWLKKNPEKDEKVVAELQKSLNEINEYNKKVDLNNKAVEQKKAIETAENEARIADELVKSIEREKTELIKTAKLPEGFDFTDDGITYNGFALTKEQLSSSSVYIGALKLASMNIGQVKTLHFDASHLDKNSLSEIESWAKENDLQLLIERPDFDGGEIRYELIEA